MLAETRKNTKNSKFEISQFYKHFGRDPPYEYAWNFGSDSVVYF